VDEARLETSKAEGIYCSNQDEGSKSGYFLSERTDTTIAKESRFMKGTTIRLEKPARAAKDKGKKRGDNREKSKIEALSWGGTGSDL